MDVRCGRCGTDYDFDDALLSSRGTMVRCTTCGHQFKVFPAHTAGAVTDRWLVEKTTGQQLVFSSLKDLQRAIGAGVVRRQDVLTRGGDVRQVGSIAELDSLFRKRQAPAHDPRTLVGIAPAQAGSDSPPDAEPAVPRPQSPSVEPLRETPPASETAEAAMRLSEPAMPTPPVSIQVPELARATPPSHAKPVEEAPGSSAQAARQDMAEQGVSAETSDVEPVPTPRSPSWPPDPPATPGAEPAGQPEGDREQPGQRDLPGTGPSAAEGPLPGFTQPVGRGRYAETLRSEESVLLSARSARPDRSPVDQANGTSGAKPIARITTERVAVRQRHAGESTMRSSEWPDGRKGHPDRRAAAGDHPAELATAAPSKPVAAAKDPSTGSVRLVVAVPPLEEDSSWERVSIDQAAPTPAVPGPARAPEGSQAKRAILEPALSAESAEPAPASPAPASPEHEAPAPAAVEAAPPQAAEQRRRPVAAAPVEKTEAKPKPASAAARPRPRRTGTWIAVLTAAAGLGAAGYVSAPAWLPFVRQPPARTESKAEGNAELDTLVQRSRQLIDTGDLGAAERQLELARGLEPNDTRLIVEAARWHLQTAELAWWRSRIVSGADGALANVVREELGTKLISAETALQRAETLGELPSSLRWARPALERMAGKVTQAQRSAAALAEREAPPEYAQAALSAAGVSVDWALAAEQLGKAASLETALGPGRFGLVFVLASSGRVEEARAHLSATARQAGTEPLFRELDDFLQRSAAAASDAGAQSDAATADGGNEPVGDFRHQLTDANNALRAGEVARAERLFRAVLDAVPSNTEALSGLADVARARNDHSTAAVMYAGVLERNPNYLPALVALADETWQSGDRQGASVLYKRVVERAGTTSSYGARATQRLRDLETGAGFGVVPDAAPPRPGQVGERLSNAGDRENSIDTGKSSRDVSAQPSGRRTEPSGTDSPNPDDFVP